MDVVSKTLTPLYVDLDGTFTRSDLLYESLVIALKSNPFIVFMCFLWLVRGKAYLKYKLSQRANVNSRLGRVQTHVFLFLFHLIFR